MRIFNNVVVADKNTKYPYYSIVLKIEKCLLMS